MRAKLGRDAKNTFFFLSPHTHGSGFVRITLLRHALPISVLILRKKPTVLQSIQFPNTLASYRKFTDADVTNTKHAKYKPANDTLILHTPQHFMHFIQTLTLSLTCSNSVPLFEWTLKTKYMFTIASLTDISGTVAWAQPPPPLKKTWGEGWFSLLSPISF